MANGLTIATTAGDRLSVDVLEYPARQLDQVSLIELWQTEWSRTDYDWLRALNGDYAQTLTITSYIARQGERAIASATIALSRLEPEVCVVGNVITRVENRGRGIAATLVDIAVRDAFSMGCST